MAVRYASDLERVRKAREDATRRVTGTHAIIYAEDAKQTRAFFRDVLDLPFVMPNPQSQRTTPSKELRVFEAK